MPVNQNQMHVKANKALVAKAPRSGKWLVAFGCFVIAALVSWFTGQGQRLAVEELYDSGHYIETCRQLVLLLHGGQALSSSTFNLDKLIEYVMLDGPALPLLTSGAFLCLNQMPGNGDWYLFSAVQCVLQGAAAALVALLSYELIGSRRWSVVAGLIWALYPAAILATRVFMSETLTAVLLLLQIYLLCGLNKDNPTSRQIGSLIGSGIVSVLVLLTKPALFAACALIALLAVSNLPGWRRKFLSVFAFGLGVALCLAPWLIFTKTCVGQVYFTPQRQPVFNVAKGIDIEADGVGGFPYTISCNMYTESDGVLNVLSSVVASKPIELASLCGRKITRLFALPWNDYRAKVFGLPAQAQAVVHRIIWLAGILGFLAVCAGIKGQSKNTGRKGQADLFIAESCALVILGHLGYLVFEAIPRYGFTSVPFVVVLAVYFLHAVVEDRQVLGKELALLAVSVLMVLISLEADLIPYLLMLCDDMSNALWLGLLGQWLIVAWTLWLVWRIAGRLVAEKAQQIKLGSCLLVLLSLSGAILFSQKFHRAAVREWQAVLSSDMVATREVWLEGDSKRQPSWAMILVDGDSNLDSARLQVNGHELNEKCETVYQFYPRKFQLINAMQLQAVSLGVKPERMRQWRAVPVPVTWLNLEGKNVVSIRPGQGKKVTIYGDYPAVNGQRKYIPSFEVFSHGKLWNSVDSLDGRVVHPIALSDVKSRNSINLDRTSKVHDLSSSTGMQVGDYRLFIALGRKCGDAVKQQRQVEQQVANLCMDELVIDAKELDYAGMKELNLSIPRKDMTSSHMQVSLTGQMLSQSAPCMATVVLIAQAAEHHSPIILPGTPKVMFIGKSWSDLNVSEILPVDAVLGGVDRLSMQLYVNQQNIASTKIVFRNLKLLVSAIDKPTLNDHWMGIY